MSEAGSVKREHRATSWPLISIMLGSAVIASLILYAVIMQSKSPERPFWSGYESDLRDEVSWSLELPPPIRAVGDKAGHLSIGGEAIFWRPLVSEGEFYGYYGRPYDDLLELFLSDGPTTPGLHVSGDTATTYFHYSNDHLTLRGFTDADADAPLYEFFHRIDEHFRTSSPLEDAAEVHE